MQHTGQADALFGLPGQARCMAAPCRIHPAIAEIDHHVLGWLEDCGLVASEHSRQQAARSMINRLAARVLPEADVVDAVLIGKWFAWFCFLDDGLDTGSMLDRPEAVDDHHARLVTALRSGVPATAAPPIERALVELWTSTSRSMSQDWATRFRMNFRRHWTASRQQALNRRDRHTPSLAAYGQLRRAAFGMFMFDLAEPLLGIEVPVALAVSRPWTTLREAVNDIIAWCNDIASQARERASHDVHNYVHVASVELGLDITEARRWVINQIVIRDHDIHTALRSLPAEFARAGCTHAVSRAISKVACGLASMPRAHLEWLAESQRYRLMP